MVLSVNEIQSEGLRVKNEELLIAREKFQYSITNDAVKNYLFTSTDEGCLFDIIYTSVLSLLKLLKMYSDNIIIVTLNNNMYWLYKCLSCLSEELFNKYEFKNIEYFNKGVDWELFKDKSFILMTDALIRGNKLGEVYDDFKKNLNISEEVFGGSKEVVDIKRLLSSSKILIFSVFVTRQNKDLNIPLIYGKLMEIKDISMWYPTIAVLFQELFIPYSVDVLMMDYQNGINSEDRKWSHTITLDKQSFKRLINSSMMWKYADYSYATNNVLFSRGIFILNEPYYLDKWFIDIHSMGIYIKYKFIENKVILAFEPYVLLSSIDVRRLFNLFKKLYTDSEGRGIYFESFCNHYLKTKVPIVEVSQDMYTTMYKAVIMRLNIYLFFLFWNSVLKEKCSYTINNFSINEKIIRENWEDSFVSDTLSSWNTISKMNWVDIFSKLKEILAAKSTDLTNVWGKDFEHQSAIMIVQQKFVQNNLEGINAGDFIALEDVMDDIKKSFKFTSTLDSKVGAATVVSYLLEMNIVKNQLKYDKNGLVSVGLKKELNCDLIFCYSIYYIYPGVLAFYDRIIKLINIGWSIDDIKKYYKNNVQDILLKITLYLKENQIFPWLMKEEDMQYSNEYFESIADDLFFQIENKRNLYNSKWISQKYMYDYIKGIELPRRGVDIAQIRSFHYTCS